MEEGAREEVRKEWDEEGDSMEMGDGKAMKDIREKEVNEQQLYTNAEHTFRSIFKREFHNKIMKQRDFTKNALNSSPTHVHGRGRVPHLAEALCYKPGASGFNS
jgi:hypothetical protein